MRLYHFLETKWALDDIRRRRLKISGITDLNDPYECGSVSSDDIQTQIAIDKNKTYIAESFSVICFSRCWSNVLMWSHYADKHLGMCLGFDVSDDILREVRYEAKPEIIGRMIIEKRADFDSKRGENIVNSLAEVKYEGWRYENEMRIHATRKEKDEATGLYFVDFSEKTVLREVIAGPRFADDKAVIEQALKDHPDRRNIKIIKARVSSLKFEVVEDRAWI